MFRRWRYYRRRMERLGRVWMETAHADNFDELFAALASLHSARWNACAQSGVLVDPSVIRFHYAAAKTLLDEHELRLYLMRFNGEPAAAFYGFHHRSRAFYYLGGFAPHLARLDPGSIMVGWAIQRAIAEGAREFSFLRGMKLTSTSGEP
jgi:CelD/BcsL family acetyltransferase involved in cellulose biosynthesis